ncbi:hypothetical protein BBBOND_0102440 [Babesia bigemina]|uniref:6-Cys domain-containing protein n=1 Tax=Babesia bigemina TaxID=5866 RepID=A0A061D865_BABBI|nr:hypothetical protein BBBOND_0102440 [Babesia bigemina]CDR93915.1 hypothetical protein BBBOND_0102440 [Babesia bigemina]|eukprot:XP_012766101.1 hypothetical protein BBBOND_0102440 [Babesia bigemina]
MAKILRAASVICAVLFNWTGVIDAYICNFSRPYDLLRRNAVVRCDMDVSILSSATAICPRRVDDAEYVWHPQPTSDGHPHIETYVNVNGSLRSTGISDVVITENQISFISVESNQLQTKLQFNFPSHELFTVIDRRLIFICGPRDLVLSDTMQRHIYGLKDTYNMDLLPWSSSAPLVEELKEMRKGFGLFLVNIGHSHLPLQGCGSRTSALFSPDNVVTENSFTGTRSCVADPRLRAPIGFVCEGRIEPNDCMKSLINQNDEVVPAPEPHKYWQFDNYMPWVVAQYFDQLALPPFTGECRCIDPETGQVKARIEIRSNTEYVCDITQKVFLHRTNPIPGPWCSVVLHPGSTLTIKVPIQKVYRKSFDGSPTVSFSQMMSLYAFETAFLPKDLMTLRQLQTIYNLASYDEIPYTQTLVGDALELDVSQISRGLVKLKYHMGRPLALRREHNSFLYHWTVRSRNVNIHESISAAINVAFAFTHHYHAVGCDRGPQNLFAPSISKLFCSTKRWGNGIGETYECTYDLTMGILWAGIHCKPDEELLPSNCDSAVYDFYSNGAVPLPTTVQHATAIRILGFQTLGFKDHNAPTSIGCICVDQSGYEKSRLIFETNDYAGRRYTVNDGELINISHSYRLLPWHEIGLTGGLPTSPEYLVLNNVSQEVITLRGGKVLFVRCSVAHGAHEDVNDDNIRPMWLPASFRTSHYITMQTPDGPEFVLAAHSDSIATTPGGFEVFTIISTARNYELGIKSSRKAVIVSKDPLHTHEVPMTFVCVKTPEQSDFSVVTGDALTSGEDVQRNVRKIESPHGYKWNVVKIKLKITDPYMHGCGVTYESANLFKPETPPIYDFHGRQIGCTIDLQAAKEAAFYCPAPYVFDPPNCFYQVSVNGEVKNISYVSTSLVPSRTNHFVTLKLNGNRVGPGEELRQSPPLECRCITIKGVVLSTIQIENYYSKEWVAQM